jgi:hypothetical protein
VALRFQIRNWHLYQGAFERAATRCADLISAPKVFGFFQSCLQRAAVPVSMIGSRILRLQHLGGHFALIIGKIMSLGVTRYTGGVVLRASGAAFGLWLAVHAAMLITQSAVYPEAVYQEQSQKTERVSPQDRMTTATLATTPGLWTVLTRPTAQFSLSSPEFDTQKSGYSARRHSHGEREDTLSFGSFEIPGAYLVLTIGRYGPDANTERSRRESSYYIDIVRQAAQSGLAADRVTSASGTGTKFGMIETADAMLKAGEQNRHCLTFRFGEAANPVTLSGWLCGTKDRPADRQQLACVIDRVHLLGAGDDRELRATFTAAELRRDARCNPPRLASTGRKTTWLDADSKAPALRGVNANANPALRTN